MSQRRYWIPQVLLWSTFIYGVNFLWALKDNLVDNPSYITYASSIVVASTFVLRAHILATSDAAQIEDWTDHFHRSARPYFVVAFLAQPSVLVVAWSSNETKGFDTTSIPFWLGAGLNAIGAISEKVWVRGIVTVTSLTMVILGSVHIQG